MFIFIFVSFPEISWLHLERSISRNGGIVEKCLYLSFTLLKQWIPKKWNFFQEAHAGRRKMSQAKDGAQLLSMDFMTEISYSSNSLLKLPYRIRLKSEIDEPMVGVTIL